MASYHFRIGRTWILPLLFAVALGCANHEPKLDNSKRNHAENSITTCSGLNLTPSTSEAAIIFAETWGSDDSAQFRAVIQMGIQEDDLLENWVLEYIPPSSQISPSLTIALHSGVVLCESTEPYPHDIIVPFPWMNSVPSGELVTLEVVGSNLANLDAETIITETVLNVYTRS